MCRPGTILATLFTQDAALQRQQGAPFLDEREAYLQYLFSIGRCKKTLIEISQMLLHVVRVLEFLETRTIYKSELEEAANRWAQEELAHRPNGANGTSAQRFTSCGRGWLCFRGLYAKNQPSGSRFEVMFAEFNRALHGVMGYRPATIAATGPPVRRFLLWAEQRRDLVSSVSLRDIDDFLTERRAAGWQPGTVAGQCQALRTFFRFAERRGWCRAGFAGAIKNPRVCRADREVTGPSWKEVRRMIVGMSDATPQDCRAKAILLLGSIYGFRNTEITRLTLDDFDWHNETFAVRRVKRGGTQHFPIQFEVGQAVLHYLRTGRPRCSCRNLFVTLKQPYRALGCLAPIVKKQMQRAGVVSQTCGTHSLRHACATELLRKGASLQTIAHFLGHRDIRAVSIYAKHDDRCLRKVAHFNLASIL
jgi:integrase/recombinase XerD